MAANSIIAIFVLSAWFLFHGCHSEVKCKNDKGQEVDWYILYKLPNMNNGGLKYLYMDESTDGWRKSRENIDNDSGTLANTLRPLLDFYVKKTVGFGYLLYSDQPPTNRNAAPSFGHSKGVVMLDKQTGVWLSHSTPKFPTYQNKQFWPNNGNANAQTFMCVTFPYNQFKDIGLQLKYIHAYSYDHDLPQGFHKELKCVTQPRCYPKEEPWVSVKTLKSTTGRDFRSFAKYTRYGDDLYSGLIVNNLKASLYVKSWGKMRRPLPSNCSTGTPHHVYNVRKVKSWGHTVDHSKWCVTSDNHWTCIADMNRERSQMNRGGGAICIKDFAVGRAFKSMISQFDQCQQRPAVSNNFNVKAGKRKSNKKKNRKRKNKP